MTDSPLRTAGVDTVARPGPAPGDPGNAGGPAAGERCPGPAGDASAGTAYGTQRNAPGGEGLRQALTALYARRAASARAVPAAGRGPGTGDAPAERPEHGRTDRRRTGNGQAEHGTPAARTGGGTPDGHLWRALSAMYAAGGVPAGTAENASLADELLRRADQDRRLTREAGAAPTPERRHKVARCHRDNADALEEIVRRHGWPAADTVGMRASTAALMILLHAPGLDLRLRCRDLIAQATADGRCPAVHFAYIADHCAVDLGEPQFYGTRIDPATLRPYPVRLPGSLDERRQDVGLGPMEEQMRALRLPG
ncbi:DUF6624 domain-containing protein [Streptomyces sp. NRRL S-340]|uniref:DUF6624 domain-containing protein n=1 Tax=Streptomyces sp. NRRL S-340 TaxID=1463901 RepID=UPI000A7B5616|nr:DUF6624 domain-containing protein [Streptomyces sp. NRRL S-340]